MRKVCFATNLLRQHVMSDLRPYICTSRDCAQAEVTYASRTDLILHLESHAPEHALFVEHDCARIYANSPDKLRCPICQEKLLEVTSHGRGIHISRHMEEIAFLVVSKSYEEWEFYSDSSRGRPAPELGAGANRSTSGQPVSEKEQDVSPCSNQIGSFAEPSLDRTSPCGRIFTEPKISEGVGVSAKYRGWVFFDDPLRSPSISKASLRTPGPYWCTFESLESCSKRFCSKSDWKRHENSRHYQMETWRCHAQNLENSGFDCATLYHRKEEFRRHLQSSHSMDDDAIHRNCEAYRIGRKNQTRFWCGFCERLVDLNKKGPEARDERFDHIASLHFSNGQTMYDWRPVAMPMPRRDSRHQLQLMTLDTQQGPIQVPVDVTAASKVADEKRKRRATVAHRFRQRRVKKEGGAFYKYRQT